MSDRDENENVMDEEENSEKEQSGNYGDDVEEDDDDVFSEDDDTPNKPKAAKKRKISQFIEDEAELDDPDEEKEDDEDEDDEDGNAGELKDFVVNEDEEDNDGFKSDEDDEDETTEKTTTKLKKYSQIRDLEEDRDLILDTLGVHRTTEGDARKEVEDMDHTRYDEDSEEEQDYVLQAKDESDELMQCRKIFGDDIIAFIQGSLTISAPPQKQMRVSDIIQSQQDTMEKIIIQQDIPERMITLMEKRKLKQYDEQISEEQLLIEAQWIYNRIENSLAIMRTIDDEFTSESDLKQVEQFLALYCNDKFEVPYIDTYRHNKVSNFRRDTLFEITRYHEEYLKMQVLHEKILDNYPNRLNDDDKSLLAMLLGEASSYDDLKLIDKQFQVYTGMIAERREGGSVYLKPTKNNEYKNLSIYLDNRIDEIVSLFFPPLLQACYKIQVNENQPVFNPTEEPEEFYRGYLNSYFLSGLSVKSACKKYLKLNLINNYNLIMSAKEHIWHIGRFNTYPTEEGAKEFQDMFHELFGLHRLRNKPLESFKDKTYLLILDGEKRGLIRQEINTYENDYRNKLITLICSTGNPLWDKERENVVDLILPDLMHKAEEIVRKDLYEIALKDICNKCNQKLKATLYQQPYIPEDKSSSFIMVMYLSSEYRSPNYILILNQNGMEIDSACYVSKNDEDLRIQLDTFLRQYLPYYIGLNTSMRMNNSKCRIVLENCLQRMNETNIDNYDENDNPYNNIEKYNDYRPKVEFINDKSCIIFAETQKSKTEFPSFDKDHRAAISMGRFMLDPLIEICRLWNDKNDDEPPILSYTVDQYQHLIPKDRLKLEWEIQFQDFVSCIGFQYTDYPHLSETLAFIPGMGRIKAQYLLKEMSILQMSGSDRTTRDILLKKGILKPIVYDNAAPYIRLQNGHPLDKTRIHPDNYSLVASVCATALGKQASIESADNDIAKATKALWSDVNSLKREGRAIRERFENIDWVKYADDVVNNQNEDYRDIINMIKEELIEPFKDIRDQHSDIDIESLFYLLADETPESLQEGMLVYPTIKTFTDRNLTGYLENGIRCIINKNEYEGDISKAIGQTLTAKILKIDAKSSFLQLTTRSSELNSEPFRKYDDYFKKDLDSIEVEMKVRQMKKQPIGLVHRSIAHNSFKNINVQTALTELEKMPDGSFLFRPSSKGVSYISLTYKIKEGQYNHFSIAEKNKPHDSPKLGAELILDGREYHSLDEIIGKYIHRLTAFYNQVKSHKYYYDGSKQKCDEYVEKLKIDFPQQIPYRLCIDKDSIGFISVCYVPGTHHQHRYIKISGYGFHLDTANHDRNEVYYTNLNKVIHQFKQSLLTTSMQMA